MHGIKGVMFFCLFILLIPVQGSRSFYFAPSAKYFKKAFAVYMLKQNGYTCLPSILSYLNHELCGGERSVNYYIDCYQTNHPEVEVRQEGIIGTRQELSGYIQQHFETLGYREAGGALSSIDAGHPIITTIPIITKDGQREAHCILIIGYKSLNDSVTDLYYMDPLYGYVCNNLSLLDFNNSYPAFTLSVLGCKKERTEKEVMPDKN